MAAKVWSLDARFPTAQAIAHADKVVFGGAGSSIGSVGPMMPGATLGQMLARWRAEYLKAGGAIMQRGWRTT